VTVVRLQWKDSMRWKEHQRADRPIENGAPPRLNTGQAEALCGSGWLTLYESISLEINLVEKYGGRRKKMTQWGIFLRVIGLI